MSSTAKRVAQTGPPTSDMNLTRPREDYLLKQTTASDRVFAEKEDRILEQAHTIKCLQSHSKCNLSLIRLVSHLERQLLRVIKLNPAAQDILNKHTNDSEPAEASDAANQLAQLLQSSTLLRSYETLMQ